MLYRTRAIADESFSLREWEFSTFMAPVTLNLIHWTSRTNVIRIPSRYAGCANMNFLRRDFQKLLSERQTDRQTDRTEIIYHTTSRVVNYQQI